MDGLMRCPGQKLTVLCYILQDESLPFYSSVSAFSRELEEQPSKRERRAAMRGYSAAA
jgi:hypothetical protein